MANIVTNDSAENFVIPSDFRDGYQVISETINPLLSTYDSALEQYNEKIQEKVNDTSRYLKIRAFNQVGNAQTFFNYESLDDLDENTNFRIWNSKVAAEAFTTSKTDLTTKINEQKIIENNRLQASSEVLLARATKDSDDGPLNLNFISVE